jgi:acetoin utilization deacetylase AcuC-like enzyme
MNISFFKTWRPLMAKTGIVKDPIYLEHKTGSYHPESPERLEVIYEMLEDKDMAGRFEAIHPREATREEIELIHEPSYFDRVATTAGKSHSSLDPDTQTSEKSFEAALLACGGFLLGIDRVMNGELDNAFALIRPPGHHAESNRGMGFCLFNNVAVGAAYAIKKYSLDRILICDWDLHHGNGTQHSFYDDKKALYFSTHQFPYYPGTGSFTEVGQGDGRGFTVNVPLSVGNGDAEYYKIFKEVLEPISEEYNPQLVLVSAGFDIYYKDPLGGMEVTPSGFAALAQVLLSIAEKSCGGKLLITLEGGYHLGGLRDGVKSVIQQLLGEDVTDPELVGKKSSDRGMRADPVIERALSTQREFWRLSS